ncbi:DUF2177 family protein [Corticibacterium sp. UT-5YL-CI-8]|nr:DUF2177 family protein [Tianweitania sp. UT-5YL-CI-8]
MKTLGIAYVATGLVFLAIDAVWLSTMASRLYRPLLGDMLTDGFNVAPAVLFYLIYIGGILFFALYPALGTGRWQTAALNGAVLGFVAYATYDLTNQATLRNWPTIITVADLAWGTLLTAASATGGFLITRKLLG